MNTNANEVDLNQEPVDLTNCDREPIHILGRVQSYGALLAISPDWMVNHASVNLKDFIGWSAADAIGMPVSEILRADAVHDLRGRLQHLTNSDSVERIFGLRLTASDDLFDVAVHLSGRSFVFEMERHQDSRRADYTSYVKPMIERISKAETPERLCDIAARQLRALTGFDRVMVYKFGENGSGTVVSESLTGQRESFKGLRYPASDIPKQARAMYKRSLLRIIADVSDHGIEIIPAVNPEGLPLDLSMSTTRAVSPVHLEYLTNMGVGASMSISILKRGELWGLFACHNDSPKTLPYTLRSAAELFGQLFAFLLEQRESDEEREDQARARILHDKLMSQLAEGATISESLDAVLSGISTVIPFDGAVGWINGKFTAVGETPTREEFMGMVKFLNTTASSRIYDSKNLASAYPKASEFGDRVAGIMVLPVSRTPRDYIVLCRHEIATMVRWAGNPDKPVTVGKFGSRLTPRKSFEAWKEVVHHTCAPWTEGERRAAEALRITLLEVVLRMSDVTLKTRIKAQESQEILIAELNHRVRNILNLIQGLINQSKDDAKSISEFTKIVGGRVHALALAHDQITKENWGPASTKDLIKTEAKAYLDTKRDRLSIAGPDAIITPPAYTTLSLVIHELMTNSMKYGALSDANGHIDIELKRHSDEALELVWKERGGPPIQAPPTRKGFGTTIIEKSIPYELNGEASVSYKMSGLEARLMLPPSFVSEYRSGETDDTIKAVQPISNNGFKINGKVLVVEDNIIIAMDAEDMLMKMGASSVMIASNVSAALSELKDNSIAFALLDINLGSETSESVAIALKATKTPFVFATGYGDATDVSKRFAGTPVVQKPYDESSLTNALSNMTI
jgi:light-regulated signal transduction histidine kinase (bacteriophytochrome)/CheY-like chemotaxis protein